MIPREGVDYGDDARFAPPADEIEVEHALDGSGLHPPNYGFRRVREHRHLGAAIPLVRNQTVGGNNDNFKVTSN